MAQAKIPRIEPVMKPPAYWKKATRELAAADPVLRELIKNSKGLTLRSRGDAFNTLARSIVGQQISVKAAQSVWNRLVATVAQMHPEIVRQHDAEVLRACGLSRGKVVYLHDLAHHFAEGKLSVDRWNEMSDDELIEELTRIRGIGRWTAEMFLIFYMMRPNVLPLDDIGLQNAVSRNYYKGKPLTRKQLVKFAKRWEPWRSVATWYMWRSLDPLPVEY
jgi:DNA-3-methyladenine glycosylase II